VRSKDLNIVDYGQNKCRSCIAVGDNAIH
jgi:hypothetical protein